jgi:Xaa-Pro aminopeptidase
VRPDVVAMLAARTRPGSTAAVGADLPLAGTQLLDRAVAAARVPLTVDEIPRYRALGAEAGRAVGEVARTLRPGVTETEIARRLADAAMGLGGRATVVLVAADDRMNRFRHPVPTATGWHRAVMLVACIQRGGLVVAVTRLLVAGQPDAEFGRRTVACAHVFGRLLDATRPGARGRDLFAAAQRAYEDVGFPGEEVRHHQGGAIGYRSREWVAHPASEETVQEAQAFAWNPSITGTKVEDTALVTGGAIEIITQTPDWPCIPIDVQGRTLHAAGTLVLE